MGAFNTLKVQQVCPVCQEDVELTIQFKYGDTWQYEYLPGETLRWDGNDIGKRWEGTIVLDGAGENCPSCGNDSDFEIFVINNSINSVRPSTGQYHNEFVARSESFLLLDEHGQPVD